MIVGRDRFCPVCAHHSSRFYSFGLDCRDDAQCRYCGSLERHRLLWLYLVLKHPSFLKNNSGNMLHVAPEPCLEMKFREVLGKHYISADLVSPRAMIKMDITNIQMEDESLDFIYCSHVLEHVVDDRKAMREFYRVLKDNGWAILLVPICGKKTYEDPSIVTPQDRLRVFGQADHVRIYGPDYVDRLIEAGFKVKIMRTQDLVDENDALKMGLTKACGDIYFCTKRSARKERESE